MSQAHTTTSNQTTPRVELKRTYKAKPEQVFAAWTKPELLTQWMGPEGFSCPECSTNPVKGGEFSITMRSPDGKDNTAVGKYLSLQPPNELQMTWTWIQEDGSLGHTGVLSIELRAVPEGTELQLVHEKLKDHEAAEHHLKGWEGCCDSLNKFLQQN